jgi:hypothetical protein
VAQAALDPRVELVLASAQELAEVVNLTYFHVLAVEYRETSLELFEAGVSEAERTKLQIDFDTAKATLDSRPINLKAYVLEWQNDAQNRRTAKWGSPLQPAGEYQLVADEERTFTDGGQWAGVRLGEAERCHAGAYHSPGSSSPCGCQRPRKRVPARTGQGGRRRDADLAQLVQRNAVHLNPIVFRRRLE